MKERPILFSGPMVRAILEGRKSQTRRVIKPQPRLAPDQDESLVNAAWQSGFVDVPCPYGEHGDLLWVRETWTAHDRWIRQRKIGAVNYRATDTIGPHLKWRPSIFMPRWASRLTLRITEVRVQRLQECSYEDAIAEGAADYTSFLSERETGARAESAEDCARRLRWPQRAYTEIWDSINGKRAPWDSNPWVWAITFERVEQQAKAA